MWWSQPVAVTPGIDGTALCRDDLGDYYPIEWLESPDPLCARFTTQDLILVMSVDLTLQPTNLVSLGGPIALPQTVFVT